MQSVPVLIVGGGPVGLTASLLLSRRGIRNLVVERHPGTAIHPKARGINARTMEIFRQQGVESGVREAGLAPERTGMIVWAKTLAGEEIERRVPWRGRPEAAEITPVRACLCAQDYLEPVLRRFAERQATATLRFDTSGELILNRSNDISGTVLEPELDHGSRQLPGPAETTSDALPVRDGNDASAQGHDRGTHPGRSGEAVPV